MSNQTTEYWKECIAQASEDCSLTITEEQLEVIVEAVENEFERQKSYHETELNEARQIIRKLRYQLEKATENQRIC